MLGLLVITIPLLIYVIGALSVRRKDTTHPDDFFVAYKRVGVTAFSSSSIAYAFQVSTIYPFLFWGASNFYLVPLVNTIGWGLGILLFYLCFNRYRQFVGSDLTLHGFLGEQYGLSVRVVASYLTIIAFLGFAISETYFGSKVLLSIVDNKNLFYVIVLASLLFVYGYIAYGGQLSSIRTDQLQLIIAYLGVFGLMLYFIYLLVVNHSEISGALFWGFVVLIVYIPAVLLFRRLRFIRISEQDSIINRIVNRVLNVSIVVIFSLVFAGVIWTLLTLKSVTSVGNFINMEGFGVAGLLSLSILPLCFQFVDLSNWQRLLSVKADDGAAPDSVFHNIRKGLLIYAIESPFTWIIFIFFGVLTVKALPNFTFQDLLIDIPKQLISSGTLLQKFFGYTFIVSVLAIMLSTVDSFIMGIIFTFVYDSYGKTRRIIDSKNEQQISANYKTITNAGRLFGLCAILVGIFFFVFFDKKVPNGGELFINLLLTFYAAQLSFFPHVFGILFLKERPSTSWANASMILGAGCGIGIGIYAVLYDPNFAWYPILACFSVSSIIYLLGLFVGKKKSTLLGTIVKTRSFYKDNRFYCWLMSLAIGCIFGLTIYFLTREKPNYLYATKTWEVTSYSLTFLYTGWFWLFNPNGRKILKEISSKGDGLPASVNIIIAMTLIGVITYLHLDEINIFRRLHIDEIYLAPINIFLLSIVYYIFCWIDKLVIQHSSDDQVKSDFRITYRNSDRPTLIAFAALFLYAAFVAFFVKEETMEFFFSGAIGFELLLSSIVWANTETV